MVMISANNLLVVYLGLELMSLSLYALAALRRDSGVGHRGGDQVLRARRARVGLPALRHVDDLRWHRKPRSSRRSHKAFATGSQANHTVLVFGVVFIVAGLAFKFGAVPFHMWVPDVYQGTPTAVDAADRRRAQARGVRDRVPRCSPRA